MNRLRAPNDLQLALFLWISDNLMKLNTMNEATARSSFLTAIAESHAERQISAFLGYRNGAFNKTKNLS